eukprot:GILI01007983.1.p1 GENE.GILI01007983.1~~GILI01007983.1.p1  ORF type:complete len:461 (-),score=77.64 GILI01007983.1:278-1660(-)
MTAELPRFGHLWEDICGYIIRPQRAEYEEAELGPEIFRLSKEDKRQYKRENFDLQNMRDMTIKCTWFYPNTPNCFPMPVVVYLHGNCGCRCDALEILHLLGKGFSLLCYDACGSGKSDGKYVSLGFYERQDLACVMEHIEETRRATAVGLWGRSMGAVTSIMYAARDPSIKCLVLDSPFSQLRRLIFDLVKQHASVMPDSMTQMAVKKIRKQIAKLAQFDIDDLDAVKYGSQCSVPTFIFHGEDDDFVNFYHSQLIAEHYKGMCFHHVVEGGHNSFRKSDVMSVAIPHLELYLIAKPEDERLRKGIAQSEKSAQEERKQKIAAAAEEAAIMLRKKLAQFDADEDGPAQVLVEGIATTTSIGGPVGVLSSDTAEQRAKDVLSPPSPLNASGSRAGSKSNNAYATTARMSMRTTDAEMGAPSTCRAEDEDTDDEELNKALDAEAEIRLKELQAQEKGEPVEK